MKKIFRLMLFVLLLALFVSTGTFFWQQKWGQKILGQNEFSEYARAEQQKHYLSGMYAPFVTKDEEALKEFHLYFDNFSYLLPKSVEEFSEKQAIKTSVKISPLKESPVSFDPEHPDAAFLAVGGPPALFSAAFYVEKNNKVTYLNNENGWPIAYGSAWHIEEDADAEAPTTYSPLRFMKDQILRALIYRVSYEEIEKTGFFPWRTLDWFGYMEHPEQWIPAFKIFINFQLKTMQSPEARQKEVDKVAAHCRKNEIFYKQLNEKLHGKLLLPSYDNIIVARNQAELDDLHKQQKNLERENRQLIMLTKEDLIKRYGFSLQGVAFAEKPHDRVLSPGFKKTLTQYLKEQGGSIINGTLVEIYTGGQHQGGVAKYRMPDGKERTLTFGQLFMSLGSQEIRDFDNNRLFDLIGATGSSGLALVYVPPGYKLPRVSVFGGTNHVPVLSEPISVAVDGKLKHLYLIRFTAGASITPAYRGKKGGYHDITITLGLINSVFKTLGNEMIIKPLTVHGCNRMVSKNGQTDWIEPYPGIHIQYGAGGGGLTRAPDFISEK